MKVMTSLTTDQAKQRRNLHEIKYVSTRSTVWVGKWLHRNAKIENCTINIKTQNCAYFLASEIILHDYYSYLHAYHLAIHTRATTIFSSL